MDRKGDLAEEPTGEKPTRPGEMSNGQTSEAQPRERGTAGTKNKKVDKEIPAPSGSLSPSPPRSLSPSAAEAEAARLGAEFLKSSGTRQEELLVQLKRSKGSAYTSALAAAVDQLSGPLKAKAREALAERLSRMTAATLRDMLQDSRPEIRRAAALACAMKDDKNFIPELAKLLEDPHDSLVRATHSALKAMTGQDFGPAANASLEERSRAAAAWKEWWEKQNTRP